MRLVIGLFATGMVLLLIGIAPHSRRPCPGPCDVSWVEVAFFLGLVLVGAAFVRLVNVVVRRVVGGTRASAVGPLVVGGTLVLVTVLLTAYAIDALGKHAWPTVVVGNQGQDPGDAFYLAGDYVFTWRVLSGSSGCTLDGTLHEANGGAVARSLVAESIAPNLNGGSSNIYLDDLPRLGYYVEAASDCTSWSLMFEPRR